jgi:hypothetical protein
MHRTKAANIRILAGLTSLQDDSRHANLAQLLEVDRRTKRWNLVSSNKAHRVPLL